MATVRLFSLSRTGDCFLLFVTLFLLILCKNHNFVNTFNIGTILCLRHYQTTFLYLSNILFKKSDVVMLIINIRGSSSVLFAYSFLLLFGQFDNIYKVEQDSLYFFLEGGFKGIYLREKNFTLSYVVSEI